MRDGEPLARLQVAAHGVRRLRVRDVDSDQNQVQQRRVRLQAPRLLKDRPGPGCHPDAALPARPWGVARQTLPLPLPMGGVTAFHRHTASGGCSSAAAGIALRASQTPGFGRTRRPRRSPCITLPWAASRSWRAGPPSCGRSGGCRRPGRAAWTRDRSSPGWPCARTTWLVAELGAV